MLKLNKFQKTLVKDLIRFYGKFFSKQDLEQNLEFTRKRITEGYKEDKPYFVLYQTLLDKGIYHLPRDAEPQVRSIT